MSAEVRGHAAALCTVGVMQGLKGKLQCYNYLYLKEKLDLTTECVNSTRNEHSVLTVI